MSCKTRSSPLAYIMYYSAPLQPRPSQPSRLDCTIRHRLAGCFEFRYDVIHKTGRTCHIAMPSYCRLFCCYCYCHTGKRPVSYSNGVTDRCYVWTRKRTAVQYLTQHTQNALHRCTQRWTWVGSIHGLGWVGSHFPAHVMCWVGWVEWEVLLFFHCTLCLL